MRELLPAEARGPLSRNLQTLVAKGLVQRGPPDKSHEEEYSFHHILIQQAAYRAIPKSARAELHHRYADWLEYVVWEPATQRAEILGYHLEQSVRYRSELWPGETQSTALSRRAAAHLETAGCAAHDRGDALAAMSLLERAAALLPSEDPALARIYTSLGTASTEAGQLERARATLDHAQRIAAANGDEGQRAHARVQALLLALKVDPNWRGYGDHSRAAGIAPRVRSKPGRAGTLPNPAATGRAGLEPRAVRGCRRCLAARRRICSAGQRPQATDRDTRLARISRALGSNAGTGRDTTLC